MRNNTPRGGDLPAGFQENQPFKVDISDTVRKVRHDLARHNLEVTLKRTKEGCFRAAKEIALESAQKAREMDEFVRKQYSDEPRKMAEWEEIMQRYEFVDEDDDGV